MGCPKPGPENWVARLCPACGLCCNGVLFGDVELQKPDARAQLSALGLTIARKGRKWAFAQPCSCFDGQLCQVYSKRPVQCRAFECGALKRVKAGGLSPTAALKLIDQAKVQAEIVRGQLRGLGNHEESLALSRRYAVVMSEPIDLAGDPELVERRAQLMLEVDKLMRLLHQNFLR